MDDEVVYTQILCIHAFKLVMVAKRKAQFLAPKAFFNGHNCKKVVSLSELSKNE